MSQMIIGSDECGTGSLAAGLVVCAVKAPADWLQSSQSGTRSEECRLLGLDDSKKLTPARRRLAASKLEQLIAEGHLGWALAQRSNTEIDQLGLARALKDAYIECFQQLYQSGDHIIVDGTLSFTEYPEVKDYSIESVIKADGKFPQVMAASILGKVFRDAKMQLLHQQYPVYGWNKSMGYGTAAHLKALAEHGPCPLHRFSYEPVKKVMK